MPRLKVYLAVFLSALIFAAIAVTVMVAIHIHPAAIQSKIVEVVEASTGAKLTFEKMDILYVPQPACLLHGVRLAGNTKEDSLTADQVKINIRVLPLTVGKIRTGDLRIKNTVATFTLPVSFPLKKIQLERMDIKMSGLSPKEPSQIDFEGAVGGKEKNIHGKVKLLMSPFDNWESVKNIMAADIKLEKLTPDNFKDNWNPDFPFQISNGVLSGHFQIEKANEIDCLKIHSKLTAEGLVYHMRKEATAFTSPAMNATFQSGAIWNTRTGEITLKESSLDFPVGKIEAAGRFMTESGEIRDLRIHILTEALERLPYYWFSFQDVIPSNIGFSGQSDLEMSWSGTWDHLTFHGNWDLTSTLLSYGTYFSKSKDEPLVFNFDYLLKKGKELSGDFSLKFEKAKAKGTIKGIDLENGKGQVNIMTNKFALAGWETMVLPLREYELSGEAKLLMNFSGNFKNTNKIQRMMNVTLDNAGAVHKQTGTGIQNVFAMVDYGMVALKIKQLRMDVQGSPVEVVATIYNLGSLPVAKGRVSSPYLLPVDCLRVYRDFTEGWLQQPPTAHVKELEEALQTILPADEPVKNLALEFDCKSNQWNVSRLEFEAHDGWMVSSGGWNWNAQPATYWANSEINHLSLARLLAGFGKEKKLAAGNLFAKLRLKGSGWNGDDWSKSVSLEGEVSVTNGEFDTFNLVGAIAKIDELKKVKDYDTGKTLFHDLQLVFKLQDGKIRTDSVYLVSDDMSLKADGEILIDGIVNYRMGVYLSRDLTKKVLADLFPGYVPPEGNDQLGPIPMLMSGVFANPEIKADPALMPPFKDQLLKRGSREVLGSFLPEELFFERRSKS
jgi:hypothetical protein